MVRNGRQKEAYQKRQWNGTNVFLFLRSVVDPNTLNLDPDPGFWLNLDPDPDSDPGPDPWLYYQF